MRQLADYVLQAGGAEIPVSAPLRGDLRPSSSRNDDMQYITMGFAAQDASVAGGLLGHDGRLVTNIHLPGRELARLRLLEVDTPTFLLVARVLPDG